MTTLTAPSLVFYDTPSPLKFKQTQLPELTLELERQRRYTDVLPLTAPEELTLNYEGRTQHYGHRFTAEGLRCVAYRLAAGLLRLLLNIADRRHSSCEDLTAHNPRLAIDIFNQVLRLRFSQLDGCAALCDSEQRLLHGVFPSSQLHYPNCEFWELLQDKLPVAAIATQFFAGKLYGRQGQFWFREAQPFHTLTYRQEQHRFWAGYYFANGDFLKMGCVGRTVVFSEHGVAMLRPAQFRARAARTRNGFRSRLDKVVGRMLSQPFPYTLVRTGLDRLPQLPFVHQTAVAKRDRGNREWLARLQRYNLPVEIAERVCADANLRGSVRNFDEAMKVRLFARPLLEHTRFDLLCALQRIAGTLPYFRRYRAETAAYDLITAPD